MPLAGMPPWFWIVGAAGVGGAYIYGKRHGEGLAHGSAYGSDELASLLDYGISPSGYQSYTGYGGSFVINPSSAGDVGNGSPPTETKPPVSETLQIGEPVRAGGGGSSGGQGGIGGFGLGL